MRLGICHLDGHIERGTTQFGPFCQYRRRESDNIRL